MCSKLVFSEGLAQRFNGRLSSVSYTITQTYDPLISMPVAASVIVVVTVGTIVVMRGAVGISLVVTPNITAIASVVS